MPVILPYKTRQLQSLSSTVSSEKLINLISTERQDNQYSGITILNNMGYTQVAVQSGSVTGRGGALSEDLNTAYIVIGTKFYSMDTSFTLTEQGTLTDATGICDVIVGTTYVFIVDITNTKGYTYNIGTDTFAAIADAQFTALTSFKKAFYLNGFFGIVTATTIAFSELNDPTSWVADRQNTRNFRLTTVIVANNSIVIPGVSLTELWVAPANPNTNFPISLSGSKQYGCVAPASVAGIKDTAYWIAKSTGGKATFVRSEFRDVTPVGNEDFDVILEGLSGIEDCEAMCFTDRGMDFYRVTAVSANKTYLYNITHGTISEETLANGNCLPLRSYMNHNKKHICLDRTTGKIFEMRDSLYQYDGGNAPRTFITKSWYDNDNYIRIPLLRLHLDTSSYGSAQTWTLAVSYDGGVNYQTSMSDAAVASTTTYAQWTRLSAGRNITLKFTHTSNNKVVINNVTGVISTSGRQGAK
jgi:hypothetical protein